MEEEDFVKGEDILNASDEEDDHIQADKKHAKLLDSISALDGQRRSKLSERTVLTETVSEFGFSQAKAERKVHLHELLGSLKNTASHGELKKQLRTVHKRTQVASVPLSRVEEAKIQRTTAYEKTKEDLSKWSSVVAENRRAEQISFPLQQPSLKLQTTDEVKTRFKPRTPLEIEIAALLQNNADTVGTHEAELTPAEERALKAMSLEEAKERRAQLQKYRALLTYKQARAKREKKIKSKKYHRLLKKEKLKKEKAQMEELQRNDPEAYIDKLEKLEQDRVKERMTLKHRGGSKFAQRQKLYGKYDDRSRDAVQNMLQTHSELTKKVQIHDADENDSESGVSLHSEDEEDDMTSSQMALTRGNNPWMKVGTSVSEIHRPLAVKSVEITKSDVQEEENDEEVDDEDDDDDDDESEASTMMSDQHHTEKTKSQMLTRESVVTDSSGKKKRKRKRNRKKKEAEGISVGDDNGNKDQGKKRKTETQNDNLDVVDASHKKKRKRDRKKKKGEKESPQACDSGKGDEVDDDAIDSLFDNLRQSRLEDAKRLQMKSQNEASKIAKKKSQKNVKECGKEKGKKASKSKTVVEKKIETKDQESDDEGLIDLSLTRKRTLEDMGGGFEQTGKSSKAFTKMTQEHSEENVKADSSKTEDVFVDPKKLFTVTTKLTNSAKVAMITDEDGDDVEEQQRLTIAQAFAEDDVIDEFTKEKTDIVDRDKPKDIDLTLPGWGEWGGAGLKPSKKKRRRFTLKAPEAALRRDRLLGNVIISEKIDDAVAEHQVNRLPFPYTSPEQFEQSIRAPIGKNWNPETAFRKLIKPKVVTKLGKIISPINKSDVFEKQKRKTERTDMDIDRDSDKHEVTKKLVQQRQKQKSRL